MIFLLFLACILNFGNAFNDFPSLMSANATMAVVVDKSFFINKIEYYQTIKTIYNIIMDATKEEMYMGGIVVTLFRTTKIRNLQDFTVLLSLASCEETWILHAAARKEQIVHLAITKQDCPRIPESEGISIPIISPGKELSQIFFDIRGDDALPWNNVNILHDDTFDKDTINKVTKAISIGLPNQKFNLVSRTLFAFKHSDSERSRKYYIKDMLETFHVDQLGKCFLIIVTVETAADVMEVAKRLNLVQPDSQWLYVIVDSISRSSTNMTIFMDLLSEGGNVAFIYNATESDTICDVSLLCHIKELVGVLANSLKLSLMTEIELYSRLSDEEFELLRLTKNKRRIEILKNIKNKLIEDALTGGACGKCLFWRFISAITWGNFFIRNKSTAHLIDSGSWTPTLGLNLTDVIFPHVVHGFRGITLPVATYHNPPWQTIMLSHSGEKDYGGLVFDVVKYLGKKLNFTYSVLSPTSNRTMKFTYNESQVDVVLTSSTRTIPIEIIDMVRANKVLFAACAYTVNDRGRDDINFTLPIFIQTYSFLTAKPGQLSRALLFAAPFAKETWACLAASVIIMGPTLYFVHKYSPSSKHSGLNSSWQCIWYVYGALLQQGGMHLPYSDSARFLVGLWWLIVMVVVATYSGSLVAFLTFPNTDTAILTIEELISHKGRISWGFPNGSYLKEYLSSAEDEKYHILLERALIHNVTQEAEIMERVRAGKHALIDWRSTLRFLMRSDLLSTTGCSYSLSTDEFMEEPIAMIIAQDSPYTKIINGELYRMHESGLMNKWITEQIPMKDKCSDSITNQAIEERKVNVADMQGIFFVLFIGVVGAIFLLCCEFYWHKRQASRRRKLIRPFLS